MSDNDLISRKALYEKTAEWEAQALHMVDLYLNDNDTYKWLKWSTVLVERTAFKYDVADAPAVQHEMSAREFLNARNRMCKKYSYGNCPDCPAHIVCVTAATNDEWPTKGVAIVEKWTREHPEERN